MPKNQDWRELFDERQRSEIALDELYARDFHHGTDGHNARMIIATFAEILDRLDLSGTDISSHYRPEVIAFINSKMKEKLPEPILVKVVPK